MSIRTPTADAVIDHGRVDVLLDVADVRAVERAVRTCRSARLIAAVRLTIAVVVVYVLERDGLAAIDAGEVFAWIVEDFLCGIGGLSGVSKLKFGNH